ncbi:MAG: NTP transferase domain-containing protein [Dehalococcoidia bacterium]
MPNTVAILLAAGESRRMGQPKALLPWQGTTLIKHQLAALRKAGAGRVIVVLGHQSGVLEQEIQGQTGVESVLNPDYQQGKTTSIKAGLSALDSDQAEAILLLNVDQPRSAKTIGYLLQQHHAANALITIPEFEGQGGHPIIFSNLLLPELLQIEEATQGIRAVVRRHREAMQRIPVTNPEVLWDLNTPEQYEAALKG